MPNTSGFPATVAQGQFHVLTTQEWLETTKRLRHSPAALHVLYYLKTLDSTGQAELEVGVRELAAILEYSPGTISKALKLLESEHLISLNLISVRVRIRSLFSSGQEVFLVGNTCFPQATPVSPRQQVLTGEKCADFTESEAQQGFVPTCGKLDDVPITRSDLVLKETIGTPYTGNKQGGPLVQPSNLGGGGDPPNQPESELTEPLPGDGTTNQDPLIERLVMHGIPLNKTVLRAIEALRRAHPPAVVTQIVENALSAMREQRNTIRNWGGFFVAAIQRGFTANGEKRRHREEQRALEVLEAVQHPVQEAVPSPAKPQAPDWIPFALSLERAMMCQDHDFVLARLQAAWADGWHEKVAELVTMRKRDWPFAITVEGVAYVGT